MQSIAHKPAEPAVKPAARRVMEAEPAIPEQAGPAWSRLATRVQTKLTVGAPDDPEEREADAVADRVLRMPEPAAASELKAPTRGDPVVRRKCSACEAEEENGGAVEEEDEELGEPIRRACADCEEEEDVGSGKAIRRACAACEAEEEHAVRRAAGRSDSGRTGRGKGGFSVSGSLAGRIRGLQGGGGPLDSATRGYFEPRFGRDFSGVRVHTGGAAAGTARELSAHAYTHGSDVVFAAGRYSPGTGAGRRLLAHELAHVVQQEPELGSPTAASSPASKES